MWYKVTEKLPEPYKCLLTLSKNKAIDNILFKGISLYVDIDKDQNYEFYTNGNVNKEVVYWTYFPELPKE